MSEKEKGAIMSLVSKLNPIQKASALGFAQGLLAANDEINPAKEADKEKADNQKLILET